MSDALLLAIDQGTTNTKAVLFDASGVEVASGSARVPIEYPQPGWVQSDAAAVLATVDAAVGQCLRAAEGRLPIAVGVSNQRESVVMWDAAGGDALAPLVSWQCGRGAAVCHQVRTAGHATMVREISGLPLDPMFSAPKLAWLLQSVEGALEGAAAGRVKLGTVDSWLLWHLTGGKLHATDLTNASRTMLMDLDRGEWSDDLLAVFAVPAAAMPRIMPSSARYGEVRASSVLPSLARLAGVPICAVAGDSHAALVGHGALRPGTVKATFGTGTSVMAAVPQRSRAGSLVSTVAWSWQRPDGGVEVMPAVEGNIYATGAALEWTAAVLGLGDDVGAMVSLAGSCESSAGVTFVPAFSGLGAPHWAPAAQGTIGGLTRGSGRAEVARAAVEAVGHQVADVLDELRALGGSGVSPIASIHADGGALRSDLVVQTVADLTGVAVVRADGSEIAALGVALLAGLGAGVWSTPDELAAVPRPTTRTEPAIEPGLRSAARERWRDAVRRAIGGNSGTP